MSNPKLLERLQELLSRKRANAKKKPRELKLVQLEDRRVLNGALGLTGISLVGGETLTMENGGTAALGASGEDVAVVNLTLGTGTWDPVDPGIESIFYDLDPTGKILTVNAAAVFGDGGFAVDGDNVLQIQGDSTTADNVVLDLDGIDFVPTGGISFSGGEDPDPGSDPSDSLTVQGYTVSSLAVTHQLETDVGGNPIRSESGSIELDGIGTVTFSEIEPLTLGGTAADLIVNLPGGPDATVVLSDDAGAVAGVSEISGLFETTTFANPTNSLTINDGMGAKDIDIQGLDSGFSASLSVLESNLPASRDNNVTVSSATDLNGGDLTINALTISIEDDITTDGGSVQLSALATIQSMAGDDVDTSGDIADEDSGDVTIDAGTNVNLSGNIITSGFDNAVDAQDSDAGDVTITTVNGNISVNDISAVGGDNFDLDTSPNGEGGTIRLISGDAAPAEAAVGNITVNGDVSTSTNQVQPTRVELTSAEDVDIDGNITTLGGNVDVSAANGFVRSTGAITTTAASDSGQTSGTVGIASGLGVDLDGSVVTAGSGHSVAGGTAGDAGTIDIGTTDGAVQVTGLDASGGNATGGGGSTGGNAAQVTLTSADAGNDDTHDLQNSGAITTAAGTGDSQGVAADVSVTSDNDVMIDGSITADSVSSGTGGLLIVAGGNVSQTAAVAGAELGLMVTGTTTLTNVANDFTTLAADNDGQTEYTDATAIDIGSVTVAGMTVNGVSTSNDDVKITNVTGNMAVNNAIALGTGDLFLESGGNVSQSAAISGAGLGLMVTGTTTLTNVANDFTTLAADNDGQIEYTDATAIDIGSVTVAGMTVNGVSTSNDDVKITNVTGNMAINSAIALGTGDLFLESGGNVSQSAAISGAGLGLMVTGTTTLTNVANDFATLAADNDGQTEYTDVTGIDIGSVTVAGMTVNGVSTSNDDVKITNVTGNMAINGAIALGTGNLFLQSAGNVTQSAAISGAGLGLTVTGTTTLTNVANDFATLAADNDGQTEYTDATGIDIGSVTVAGMTVNGVSTSNDDVKITNVTGNMAINGAIALGTGDLFLQSAGNVTQSAAISGAGLGLTVTGTTTLTNVANDFATLAADNDGQTEYTDVTGIDIGSVTVAGMTVNGVSTSNDDVKITNVTGNMAVNNAIALGTGDLFLESGGNVSQSAAISGAGLGLMVTGTTTLTNVANAFTTLAADNDGQTEYTDATAIDIGSVTVAGMTVNGITTSNDDVKITNVTGDIGISNAVALGTGDLFLQSGGNVSQSAAISGAGLGLMVTGTTTLTNVANDFTTLAADNDGQIEYTDATAIDIGSVTVAGMNVDNVITLTTSDVTIIAASILDGDLFPDGPGIDIDGQNLTLTATTGSVGLANGDIFKGTLNPIEVRASNNLVASAVNGAIVLNPTVAGTTTLNSNNVGLVSAGTLTITDLNVTGDLRVEAADVVASDGTINLTANRLLFRSAQTETIGTNVAQLDASAADLVVNEVDAVDLVDLDCDNIAIASTSSAGDVNVSAAGSITVSDDVIAGQDATSNSTGSLTMSAVGAGSRLIVNDTLLTDDGDISLQAADAIAFSTDFSVNDTPPTVGAGSVPADDDIATVTSVDGNISLTAGTEVSMSDAGRVIAGRDTTAVYTPGINGAAPPTGILLGATPQPIGQAQIQVTTSNGNVTLGSIQSANNSTNAISVQASNQIIDGGDTHSDIVANNPLALVSLQAATGIGSGNAIDTTISTANATNTTSGTIELNESDSVALDTVNNATRDVSITAAAAITDGGDANTDIVAGTANLQAATGIGSGNAIDTTISTADATNTTSGTIELNESDSVALDTVNNANRDVSITAAAAITDGGDANPDIVAGIANLQAATGIGSGNAIDTTISTANATNTTSGTIELNESDSVALDTVNNANRDVSITAAAAITDGGDANTDIVAGIANLQAATGIGSGNAIDTTISTANATNTTSDTIELNESDSVALDTVNNATRDVSITAAAAITDGGDANTDIVAGTANLQAATGIGSGNAIDTTISTANATNTTSGTIELNESDSVALDTVNNATRDVSITAVAAITDAGDANTDIVAGIANLQASTGIGSGNAIDTTISTANATNTTSGTIELNESNSVALDTVNNANRDVSITAAAAITDGGDGNTDIVAGTANLQAATGIGSGNAIDTTISTANATNTTSGTIELNESDSVALDTVNNANRDVTITAAAAITDGGDANPDIVAGTANLQAGTGIGSGNAIDTTISTANATNTTSGTIELNESDSVALDTLNNANRDVSITAAAAITDGGDGNTDIVAGTANLQAGTGIGSGNAIDTTISTANATNTTSGTIELNESDSVALDTVNNANRDVSITAAAAITDGGDANTDIVAGIANLQAGTGIGSGNAIDTTISTANATNTTSGTIELNESDSVALDTLNNATRDVSITAAAAITDGGDTNPDIVAGTANLLASTGIGSADSLDVILGSVAADNLDLGGTATGNIQITEVAAGGNLDILRLRNEANASAQGDTANGVIRAVVENGTLRVLDNTVANSFAGGGVTSIDAAVQSENAIELASTDGTNFGDVILNDSLLAVDDDGIEVDESITVTGQNIVLASNQVISTDDDLTPNTSSVVTGDSISLSAVDTVTLGSSVNIRTDGGVAARFAQRPVAGTAGTAFFGLTGAAILPSTQNATTDQINFLSEYTILTGVDGEENLRYDIDWRDPNDAGFTGPPTTATNFPITSNRQQTAYVDGDSLTPQIIGHVYTSDDVVVFANNNVATFLVDFSVSHHESINVFGANVAQDGFGPEAVSGFVLSSTDDPTTGTGIANPATDVTDDFASNLDLNYDNGFLEVVIPTALPFALPKDAPPPDPPAPAIAVPPSSAPRPVSVTSPEATDFPLTSYSSQSEDYFQIRKGSNEPEEGYEHIEDDVGWKLLQPKRLKQWIAEQDFNGPGYELWLITTKVKNGQDVTFERPVLKFDVFDQQPFPMEEPLQEQLPEMRLEDMPVDEDGNLIDEVPEQPEDDDIPTSSLETSSEDVSVAMSVRQNDEQTTRIDSGSSSPAGSMMMGLTVAESLRRRRRRIKDSCSKILNKAFSSTKDS